MYRLLDLPDILVQQHLFAFDILQPAPRSPYMKRRPPCCLFPKRTPQGIDRLRRFGDVRRYAPGEALFLTGEVNEVARRALFTGARVMAARREELPDRAPLTAILRYEFLSAGAFLELDPESGNRFSEEIMLRFNAIGS
jgi:hypothetical protein